MRNQKTALSIDQLATLNDLDLARAICSNHNQAAVDEFNRRYGKIIEQEAGRACRMDYDLDLNYEEKAADTLSEAYVAADNALRLYNGTSPLGAFLRSKIRFHFADVQRANATHSGRETVLSYYESSTDDDDDCGNTDYIEAPIANAMAQQRERDADVADCYKLLLRYVKPGKQLTCIKAMLEAYAKGVQSPVMYAAEKLDCTRQQVYNHLNALRDAVPLNVVREIMLLFK